MLVASLGPAPSPRERLSDPSVPITSVCSVQVDRARRGARQSAYLRINFLDSIAWLAA
jgi:hypothetical protein